MKTSLLTLVLFLALASAVNAQNSFQFAPPLPFPQVTWTDGIVSGDELFVFLATDPAEPETRRLWRVRLAGIQAPQSTGGGITEALAGQATLALANLTSSGPLFVQVITIDATDTRAASPSDAKRLIVTVTIPTQNKLWGTHQDAGETMLRAGLVLLRCGYRGELPEEIANRYADAEKEAKANRRGVWRWVSSLVYEDCIEGAPRRVAVPENRGSLPRRP